MFTIAIALASSRATAPSTHELDGFYGHIPTDMGPMTVLIQGGEARWLPQGPSSPFSSQKAASGPVRIDPEAQILVIGHGSRRYVYTYAVVDGDLMLGASVSRGDRWRAMLGHPEGTPCAKTCREGDGPPPPNRTLTPFERRFWQTMQAHWPKRAGRVGQVPRSADLEDVAGRWWAPGMGLEILEDGRVLGLRDWMPYEAPEPRTTASGLWAFEFQVHAPMGHHDEPATAIWFLTDDDQLVLWRRASTNGHCGGPTRSWTLERVPKGSQPSAGD